MMHSDDDYAIRVSNISKSFKLPHEKHSGIKNLIISGFKKKKSNKSKRFGSENQQVIKDMSFDIKKGDFLGIVGRNGSGKSTLLKLLAGIYSPDKGSIQVNGTLTPFIELGVGFNPELTGRENVYLNGALLGFSRAEMDAMYKDIVFFAELENFMDQKLKNYSSGMQVRLAFSIAIRAQSDILVLDEVLAVGDEAFQKKCFAYFDQLKRQNKTVVLVTHDMSAVERFCNKAILITQGTVTMQGNSSKVAAEYSRQNDDSYNDHKPDYNNKDAPFSISLTKKNGKPGKTFSYGERMRVTLEWHQDKVRGVGVAIFCANGEYVFGPNTYQDKTALSHTNKAVYSVDLNLNEGDYFVKAVLLGKDDKIQIAFIEEGPEFTVKRDYENGRWGGVTKLKYEWE